MSISYSDLLQAFTENRQGYLLLEGLHGLEKESLRVDDNGHLAMTPHPKSLGNSLTDPHITTDFSESQLEFITSPFPTQQQALAELENLHRFATKALQQQHERIWPLSMPARLPENPADIPIARFGESPEGQQKEIYRRGLALRYGAYMQTISGVHYNISFSQNFWSALKDFVDPRCDLQTFINERSLHLVRNFIRNRWLLVLLFGASPNHDASYRCRSLNSDRDNAASLRLSRCGYSNPAKVPVSYNNFQEHLQNLHQAVATPHPAYAALGLERDGIPIQLNDHLLQLGNEYYFPIRLKPPKPYAEVLEALTLHGVSYIEMRMFDLNPYEPTGIELDQLYFAQLFLLYCLLEASPALTEEQLAEGGDNQQAVALKGRDLSLLLSRNGTSLSIESWGEEIFSKLHPLAELLDQNTAGQRYRKILGKFADIFKKPAALLSFQILKNMNEKNLSFLEFGLELSNRHANFLTS